MAAPPKKLLDQVREAIRIKHYSYRTEQTYVCRTYARTVIEGLKKRAPTQSYQ
jgi:hypothetical protein